MYDLWMNSLEVRFLKKPLYDIKESDDEAPEILELWGMRSIPSLLLLKGPLWPGEVAPDRILSLGQKELLNIQTMQTNDLW